MTNVVSICTSGTPVKKVAPKTVLFFDNVEVQIEKIKIMQSFIGLTGLIFEKKWQKTDNL